MKSARVQTSLLLVAVVLAILFASSEAFGTGAPDTACVTATPGHVETGTTTPISPQTGDGPYNITFDVQEYVQGDEVQVTIVGTFRGFLLQARRVSDDVPVGTFTAPETTIGQLLLCTTSDTTVTHTNTDEKTDQVFTWQVQDAGTGDVRFFATVATDYENFYVGIESEIFAVTDAPTTMGEPTTAEMTTANACDLSMPDNKCISGRHCNLFRKNNTVWLEDTSTNGTWLNGVKIGKGQKQRLFHKDEVAVVHQDGNQVAKDIVYRYEDLALLEAERESLDQTQEMNDPEENTEDYVFEDIDKTEGESRKRKKGDDSEHTDEPAAKRLEGEKEEEFDKKQENTPESSQKKSSGNANPSLVDDHIKGTAEAIEDAEKDRTGGKGDGDADEGGREEKEATGGKGDGEGEKKTKEEGAKAQQEDEEPDDILETLICSICQDILHKCISLQPCMHSFCAACISGWMKHSKRCPQCRKSVKRFGHNYIVNSLVDAYLKQNPDKRRTKEDLEEMDSRGNVPCNMTLEYDALDSDDEDGDYDPSEDEEEEEQEQQEEDDDEEPQPPACRQCPHYVQALDRNAVMSLQATLDPSTSSAPVSGNAAASTSSGDGASPSTSSSSPSKRVRIAVGGVTVPMPTPPPFQCNLETIQHVNCSCCVQPMPKRLLAPDMPPQTCCACGRNYCHLYWGCKQYNCLGCLNKFRDMKFSESVLDTIVNNNRYESTIFKDFMLSRGHNNIHLVLQEVLNGLDAGKYSTPETQVYNIRGHTAVCYTCSLRLFQQLAYLYRAGIPKNDLPILVTARPDCHWGKGCRTQYNKPHHAANFSHVCEQIRF